MPPLPPTSSDQILNFYPVNNCDFLLNGLSQKLKGKIILLGIGNTLREDDGFGCRLAQNLKDKVNFKVLDAGSVPENFLGAVIKENPDCILLVDAVDFAEEAAKFKLFNADALKTRNFFLSHDSSVSLLFGFLKINTKAEIYLLAIQPKAIGLGEKMSPGIEECLKELSNWFLEKFRP